MGTASDDDPENEVLKPEKGEQLLGWMTLLTTVLLVCATTVLFAAGQAFRTGYWYELGFDLVQLPSDFHETLFWGFSGGAPLLFSWLIAALVSLPGLGVLMWLAGALWKWALDRWRSPRRIAPRLATPPRRRAATHVKLIASFFLLLPVIYFLVIASFATAEFQKAGTAQGQQIIQAFRTNAAAASAKYRMHWIEIWFDSSTADVMRGYRLLCTERFCSIYDPDPEVRSVRLISLESLKEIRVVERQDMKQR